MLTTGQQSKWQYFTSIAKKAPYYLVPRVNSGNLALDALYLLYMLFLQETILPYLTGGMRFVDLITPWLVLNVVLQSPWRATFLAFFAAIAQETHSAFPAGTYLACYWIIVTLIGVAKPALSWRHAVPWLVTLLVALLWVRVFELFIILMTRTTWTIELTVVLSAVVSVFAGTLVGLKLAQQSRETLRHQESDA